MKEQQIQSGILKNHKLPLFKAIKSVVFGALCLSLLLVLVGCSNGDLLKTDDAKLESSDPLKTPFIVGPNTEPSVKGPTTPPPSN